MRFMDISARQNKPAPKYPTIIKTALTPATAAAALSTASCQQWQQVAEVCPDWEVKTIQK